MSIENIQPIKCKRMGALFVGDSREQLPFTHLERFYSFDPSQLPPESIRGNHAHKKSEQLHICLAGSVTVSLDDGTNKKTVRLEKGEVLHIKPLIWHSITLHEGFSLIVLAIDLYDENDYIRDYTEFKRQVKKFKK